MTAPRRMRLARREVTDLGELRAIVDRAKVLHVGSADAEGPFVVPMSFGYEVLGEKDGESRWVFWMHSAGEGRKADAWDADPVVALELDVPAEVIEGDFACAYSYAYESVMAVGCVSRVTGSEEKVRGLTRIMEHMAPGAPVSFSEAALERTVVWRAEASRLTGKRRDMV